MLCMLYPCMYVLCMLCYVCAGESTCSKLHRDLYVMLCIMYVTSMLCPCMYVLCMLCYVMYVYARAPALNCTEASTNTPVKHDILLHLLSAVIKQYCYYIHIKLLVYMFMFSIIMKVLFYCANFVILWFNFQTMGHL